MKIGCIGQGFVGKNMANDFESRGFSVVRYSLEPEYCNNAKEISTCDVVFIAVPTPTTPAGFDYNVVAETLSLVREGCIAVIKSTVLPGTSATLQQQYSAITVLFSPEFLSEKSAAYDAANPIINVVGVTADTKAQQMAAKKVMDLLPTSEHNQIVSAEAAELFKYAHNLNGYFRVILSNLLFEVAEQFSVTWEQVKTLMDVDVMMSPYYNNPVHKAGRGAGGNCFIKDMAAFRQLYQSTVVDDTLGLEVLRSLERKNAELLTSSGKDQSLLRSVYDQEDLLKQKDK